MCTVLLPPGDNPIAVNKCIKILETPHFIQNLNELRAMSLRTRAPSHKRRILEAKRVRKVRLKVLKTYPTAQLIILLT